MEQWTRGEVARAILEILQTQRFADWYGSEKLDDYRRLIKPDDGKKHELLEEINDLFNLRRRTSPE